MNYQDDRMKTAASMPSWLPASDIEFITNYLTFIDTKNPSFFMPVIIICIIIGFIGNYLFFYFFGNKQSRVYYTKDAVFFRRMAILDMLVCLIILPYTIFFEAKLVKYNIICKVMEYIRHVIMYASHLFLTAYTRQFTSADNYYLVEKKFEKSLIFIVVISCVISFPVLVIFEVGENQDFYSLREENASRAQPIIMLPLAGKKNLDSALQSRLEAGSRYDFFRPQFCHMNLNFDIKRDNFFLVKTLTTIHVLTMGWVFMMCTVIVVVKLIQYLDSKPLMGQRSVFIKIVAINHPEIVEKLQRIEQAEFERKKQKRLRRQTSNGFPVPENDLRVLGDNLPVSGNNLPFFGDNLPASDSNVPGFSLSVSSVSVTIASRYNGATSTVQSSTGDAGKPRNVSIGTSVDVNLAEEIANDPLPSAITSVQIPTTSLVKYIFLCECFKSNPKQIQLLGSAQHKPVLLSYKKSLMVLIIINLLVMCATGVGYIITEEKSFILNLVNFKSIFAFYIISLLHRDLYKSVWSGVCCRCCKRKAFMDMTS